MILLSHLYIVEWDISVIVMAVVLSVVLSVLVVPVAFRDMSVQYGPMVITAVVVVIVPWHAVSAIAEHAVKQIPHALDGPMVITAVVTMVVPRPAGEVSAGCVVCQMMYVFNGPTDYTAVALVLIVFLVGWTASVDVVQDKI